MKAPRGIRNPKRGYGKGCTCKASGFCNVCRAFHTCQIRPAIWKLLEGRAISVSNSEGIWINYKVCDEEDKR